MRRAALAALVALVATRAAAFPAFARKYGISCTACHVAWPILNQQGVNFRDNGYQFGLGKDDPVQLPPAYVPIALRTTPAYGYTRTTNQPSDAGPVTTQTGGIGAPGVDVLTGGTIASEARWSEPPVAGSATWYFAGVDGRTVHIFVIFQEFSKTAARIMEIERRPILLTLDQDDIASLTLLPLHAKPTVLKLKRNGDDSLSVAVQPK